MTMEGVEVAEEPAANFRAAEPDSVVVGFEPSPDPQAAPEAEAQPLDLTIPNGWYAMDDAPDNGRPIWLLNPETRTATESVWRHTRWFDPRGGKWRHRGYWAVRNAGGLAVDFQPFCWRPV